MEADPTGPIQGNMFAHISTQGVGLLGPYGAGFERADAVVCEEQQKFK